MNGKSTVVYDEVPIPCYNENICYIRKPLSLLRQELQHRPSTSQVKTAYSPAASSMYIMIIGCRHCRVIS